MNKNLEKENEIKIKPAPKKNLEKLALALKRNLIRRKATKSNDE